MTITLTTSLLIDLFRRDRRTARRIHAAAASMSAHGMPDLPVRCQLHHDQIRQLDFRLSVLLDEEGDLSSADHDDACGLQGYLETIFFLAATDPSLLAEKHLVVGDPSGADTRINRAAAAAKRDLAPGIRKLCPDYSLGREESVTVAFAIYGQAVLFHPRGSLEREMVESYGALLREPLPPLWVPREPYHRPPSCRTIFPDHAGTPPAPPESVASGEAVDQESVGMFPFLGIGKVCPSAALHGATSPPLIGDNLAEALRRRW